MSNFKQRVVRFIQAFLVTVLVLVPTLQPSAQTANHAQWFNAYSFDQPQDYSDHLRIRQAEGEKIPVEFVRIVDGDTVRLKIDGSTEEVPVRLIGMDTPESVHPNAEKNSNYGHIASQFTEQLLQANKDRLTLEYDVQERDQYQRVLGYLWIDDLMVNEILLAEGFAQIATYPPNTRYVDQFILTQEEARNSERGFWSPDHLAIFVDDKAPAQSTADSRGRGRGHRHRQDEAAPVEEEENVVEEDNQEVQYIGNANSHKFHYPTCPSVKQMKDSNKVNLYSRDSAINNGYDPCGRCNP